MSSVLEHYNPHSTNSQLVWEGLRSSKFGKTKVFLPKRDIINTGFDFPNQSQPKGRKHFDQKYSPQKQFRSIVKIIPPIDHWHPRQSKKKVFSMSFTNPHPRRQRGHHISQFPITNRQTAGIRTFYNTKVREQNVRQYSVQDRMQRKHRIDQAELRRTFFIKDKGDGSKFWL